MIRLSILHELVQDIPIPKMVKVKQSFDDKKIDNLSNVLLEQFDQKQLAQQVKPGMEIAVAVGSRGLDRLVEMTKTTIDFLKKAWRKAIYRSMHGESWRRYRTWAKSGFRAFRCKRRNSRC